MSANSAKMRSDSERQLVLGIPAPGSIYAELALHQRQESWPARATIALLHEWAERFNVQFKLEVPEFALRVDELRKTRYGHFRYNHNGFGLRGEIAINALYLPGADDGDGEHRQSWEVLGTLLHEMLHAWQQAHGTSSRWNYHNAEFREKALFFGLVIDTRGVTHYLKESLFTRLLSQHGVAIPPLDVPVVVRRIPGESKLKKWSCGCTNVRCAVAHFRAQCLRCGQPFEQQM
jgi:hypothetical protein